MLQGLKVLTNLTLRRRLLSVNGKTSKESMADPAVSPGWAMLLLEILPFTKKECGVVRCCLDTSQTAASFFLSVNCKNWKKKHGPCFSLKFYYLHLPTKNDAALLGVSRPYKGPDTPNDATSFLSLNGIAAKHRQLRQNAAHCGETTRFAMLFF